MIHTLGYARYTPTTLVEHLVSLGVDVLVDVRYSPSSRRPGFSQAPLARRLNNRGVDYLHFRELGAPKHLRELLKGMGDYDLFFSQYKLHLHEHHDLLAELAARGRVQRVALMCLESDPAACHRHILAEALKRDWPDLQIAVA